MAWKRIWGEVALLLMLALCAGLAMNLIRSGPTKLAWIGNYDLPGIAVNPPVKVIPAKASRAVLDAQAIAPAKDPGLLFLAIDGDTAQRLHGAGALFIDARRSQAYESGHVAGARSIPVWESDADARVAAMGAEGIPFDAILVIYCSGGDCADSEMAAQKIAVAGFFNLYIYQQGYPDWQARGWPIRQGKTP